jgi:hypothetical protein
VWLTLTLLLAGPLWLWELNESWAVGPVAAMVRQQPAGVDAAAPVLWHEAERPSLNWYAGRRVRGSAGPEDLPPAVHGQRLLLSRELPQAPDWHCLAVERAGDFGLYRCQP